MSSASSIYLNVPYHGDPLVELATRVIHDHRASLPDLSQVSVLLPDNTAARQLRRQLLQAAKSEGHTALLGPHILSLRDWLKPFLPENVQLCDEQSRELYLVEALLEKGDLLGGANPWALAENLLQLFDELTLNQVQLPEQLNDFNQQLAEAYQLVDKSLAPFSHEARIVHTLWQAWQQQLEANGQLDMSMAYLLSLNAVARQHEGPIYLAGYDFLSQGEKDWLRQLDGQGQATVLQTSEQLDDKSDTDYRQCLDRIYEIETAPIQQRARTFAEQIPSSPLADVLSVYSASNHEEEARAVDVQVRRWLLAGRKRIGIVTENRRLARRVRALLERAGIQLEDASGWALSTTRAAAGLEALLQCLEEDFSHIPFLDLLKSPLIFSDLEANSREIAVYRLEQDVILHENIGRGLSRYRSHLLKRQQRLPDWMPETSPTLLGMLDRFDSVAARFAPLLIGRHPARDYLQALNDTLTSLAMEPALSSDAAGMRILQTLDKMALAAEQVRVKLGWLDFRSWLGRQLELANFKPAETGSPVQLMGLAQSTLQNFDSLIIASAEADYLPGQSHNSPFFNQAVRKELGLTTSRERRQMRFQYYRRLLESAKDILITLRHEQDGEPVAPSPWLAQLQAFHQLAWGEALKAEALKQLVASPKTQLVETDDRPMPTPQAQPRPVLNADQFPGTLSASDYQLLMDCPYHFFAARCLKLAAPESIREELAKADYGQRVHRCLEAFHSGVPNLPGPFKDSLHNNNRQQAIELLTDIANQLFADDLADNFAHHAWLHLWQAIIPEYIDWQIQRNQQWQVARTEQQCDAELTSELKIKGRLDRIDNNKDQLAIVDYKTGSVSSNKDVKAGEAIQLPFYARLSQQKISRVEYLKLDKPGNIGSAAVLEGDELDELMQLTEQRLIEVIQQIKDGEGLPAWVDEKKCGWCEMETICRKQVWEDSQ
ncbi:MAG: PD-(D/E)XK nuclease family protein [Gammaproteobacteria bacterium]|nr:PD-(D/E)XK nuclease family protein [Gammaproteobacteria bacterium]